MFFDKRKFGFFKLPGHKRKTRGLKECYEFPDETAREIFRVSNETARLNLKPALEGTSDKLLKDTSDGSVQSLYKNHSESISETETEDVFWDSYEEFTKAISDDLSDLYEEQEPQKEIPEKNSISPQPIRGYKSLSLSDLIIEHVILPARRLRMGIMKDWPYEDILLALHTYQWLEKEVEYEFKTQPELLRQKSGLPVKLGTTGGTLAAKYIKCPVCYAYVRRTFELSCGHCYCTQCYINYIKQSLGKKTPIICIGMDCGLALTYSDVQRIINYEQYPRKPASKVHEDKSYKRKDQASVLQKLNRSPYQKVEVVYPSLERFETELLGNKLLQVAMRQKVDKEPQKFKWCPFPNCGNVVELLDETAQGKDNLKTGESSILYEIPIVKCASLHEFCFSCQSEDHLPCPCSLAKSLLDKSQNSKSVSWIKGNTQACPTCKAPIQKSDGCSHMTCLCGRKFDWVTPSHQSYYTSNGSDQINDIPECTSWGNPEDEETMKTLRACLYNLRRELSADNTVLEEKIALLDLLYQCLLGSRRRLFWSETFISSLLDVSHVATLTSLCDQIKLSVRILLILLEDNLQEIRRCSSAATFIRNITLVKEDEIVAEIFFIDDTELQILDVAGSIMKDVE